MDQLTDILQSATARIAPMYFHVKVDGGDPVYRERVYCYELYHQMRCLWPDDTDFYLNGELDKRAHPILCELGADYAKPDLLVHQPGRMSGNDTIFEVKSSSGASREGIAKDLRTLSIFRTAVGYQRAIYLVFGYEADAAVARVRQVANSMDDLPPIELWAHASPGEPAHEVSFGDPDVAGPRIVHT